MVTGLHNRRLLRRLQRIHETKMACTLVCDQKTLLGHEHTNISSLILKPEVQLILSLSFPA